MKCVCLECKHRWEQDITKGANKDAHRKTITCPSCKTQFVVTPEEANEADGSLES